jgi:hypothetical protein
MKEYYKSLHWKQFTKKMTDPDNTVCELCGCARWKWTRKKEKKINRVFNCHHKSYQHLWKEKREDVMVLCHRCHDMCHDILKISSDTEFVTGLKQFVSKYFTYEK